MSYCVNCGVELEAAQKNCPLCNTEVINPAQSHPVQESKTFPTNRDELQRKDRMFWLQFISVLLAVPIATCVISNLLFDHRLTWSVYVTAGVFISWVLSTSPMYFKTFSFQKMLTADMAGILIGLFVMELAAQRPGWFVLVALPIVLFIFAALFTIILFAKSKHIGGLGVATSLFITATLTLPAFEALLDVYLTGTVTLFWSWFLTAPFLAVAILLMLLSGNKRFKEELTRRLHF